MLPQLSAWRSSVAARGGGAEKTLSTDLAETRWWACGSRAADARGHRRHHLDLHAAEEALEPAEVEHVEGRPADRPESSMSTSTLAWPSMRVTGSMVMVRLIGRLPSPRWGGSTSCSRKVGFWRNTGEAMA